MIITNSIFDDMLLMENREEFLVKKAHSLSMKKGEHEELEAYIMSEECTEDIRRLKNGDYYIEIPILKFVRKSEAGKKRKVLIYHGKSRMMLKYVTHMLHRYDGCFSENLYSFRYYKNHNHAFDALKAADPRRECYILKMDIKNFANSLDREIAMSLLEPVIKDDPEFTSFMRWIVNREEYYYKYEPHREKQFLTAGMPMGTFITNLYLKELDEMLTAESELVTRYTDDILIVCRDLESVEKCRKMIMDFLKKRKLEINEKKTEMLMPGDEFDYLGIRVLKSGFDVAHVSKRKIMRKFKLKKRWLLRRIQKGEISRREAAEIFINYCNRYFFDRPENGERNWIMWSFPVITTAEGISEVDHYIQDCLRCVASGKNGNARYRVSYEDLKKMGYRSLVHEYYCERQKKTIISV